MTASMKAVLRQYMKSGVLFHAGLSSLLNGFDRNGMMITEQAVNNKVLKRTRRKYRRFIEEHRLSDEEIRAFQNAERSPENDRVYVYWAQGIENAPELVKACVQSLKDWLPEREIILLTADNLADYVQLPEAVMEQYRSGRIGAIAPPISGHLGTRIDRGTADHTCARHTAFRLLRLRSHGDSLLTGPRSD